MPGERIRLRGENETVTSVDTMTFRQIPDGTEVTYTAEFGFKGAARYLAPLFRPRPGPAREQDRSRPAPGPEQALTAVRQPHRLLCADHADSAPRLPGSRRHAPGEPRGVLSGWGLSLPGEASAHGDDHGLVDDGLVVSGEARCHLDPFGINVFRACRKRADGYQPLTGVPSVQGEWFADQRTCRIRPPVPQA